MICAGDEDGVWMECEEESVGREGGRGVRSMQEGPNIRSREGMQREVQLH